MSLYASFGVRRMWWLYQKAAIHYSHSPFYACNRMQFIVSSHRQFIVNNTAKCSIITQTFLGAKYLPQQCQSRNAGSSKWHNIKDTKTAHDLEKQKKFQKISIMIKKALKDGSSNPVSNQNLDDALKNAKRISMPKATVDKIMETFKNAAVNGKDYTLEYRGPAGLGFVVELFTDHIKRTKILMATVLKKSPLKLVQASALHNFSQKGILLTQPTVSGRAVSIAEAEDHAIEGGAEDVSLEDDTLEFICDAKEMFAVRGALEKIGYVIRDAEVQFTPNNPVTLDEDQMDALQILLNKFDEIEEIVKVHVNVK